MTSSASKPSILLSMMELRAPFEILSLLPSLPLLNQLAPFGEKQPVLVIPGFMTADNSTLLMRHFLNAHGFRAFPWKMGRNPGLQNIIYRRLEKRVLALQDAYSSKVSVVGWSLGGIYARILAHKLPDSIRQVITLCAPFKFSLPTSEGVAASSVVNLYEKLNPHAHEDKLINGDPIWEKAPPVPSTSIYSVTDGIASWRTCIDTVGKETENLRINGSHIGMTHNPIVLYTVAERLAQPEGEWSPFRSKLAHRLLFNKAFCPREAVA